MILFFQGGDKLEKEKREKKGTKVFKKDVIEGKK